ncbi:hypothetical protein EYF80_032791 [Liparis tanakae]|uniref:Uncharacterized protein n=1 Tax=Liparis tanakae TaxID=230148 RepID=A0A4Z2GUQ8_9TELE|nr:hypothetical protein EYF80_032791 [Liparis tanakae]
MVSAASVLTKSPCSVAAVPWEMVVVWWGELDSSESRQSSRDQSTRTDPDPAETSPPWTDPDPAETSPPGQTQIQQRPVHQDRPRSSRDQSTVDRPRSNFTCSLGPAVGAGGKGGTGEPGLRGRLPRLHCYTVSHHEPSVHFLISRKLQSDTFKDSLVNIVDYLAAEEYRAADTLVSCRPPNFTTSSGSGCAARARCPCGPSVPRPGTNTWTGNTYMSTAYLADACMLFPSNSPTKSADATEVQFFCI